MTKRKIEHASADVGLIMSAYNLRRLFNILGFKELTNYLNGILENLSKSGFFIASCSIKPQGIKLYFRNLLMKGKPTKRIRFILVVSF